ncbi:MAG: hypothetical protein COB02_14305 [Candidatus Cloacimonadota bacterium]|nr:MAG: hypothetical protein COB02_14305 [Candidatus Cloacimonadota bacterium]
MKSKDAINRYISYCMSAKLKEGFDFLNQIENPSKLITTFKSRVENRFFISSPKRRFKTKIKWIREILSIYYDYYIDVMVHNLDFFKAEKKLAQSLSKLSYFPQINDINEIEKLIDEKFQSIGWHFLGGVTLPFRGPYIYETLEKNIFSISLPNNVRDITVNFMKDFHSLSWLNYATFGKSGTGGWAKKDALYCVIDNYDQSSESFLISYLKHEAQHFDDYQRFPIILEGKQEVLEYRAKLAELIYSNSMNLFYRFMNESKNDKNFPHLLASFQIKRGFEKRLKSSLSEINISIIQEIALQLYNKNTNDLENNKCWDKTIQEI